MDKQSMLQVAEFLDKRRKRMRWIRIICAVAAVVVFCTIYALILPAVTMEREAACGFEEHQHGESCYQTIEPQKQLNCVYIPHEHGTECYDEAEQLICEMDVEAEHVHGDECYVAVETETAEPELICQLPEHSHVESCYPTQGADLTADVENAADWEATFSHVTLTGDWRVDVLAIAETQLGYEESTDNYIELETGDRKGYTRYGAWYGDSYGDWCAMFVSFCLNYAEIPEEAFPRESNCSNWIEELTELGLYQEASAETLPTEGDLIFFNWDEYEDSDHVGLVTEVVTNENGATTITTIEGNASDVVKHKTYELGDTSIMGYGVLVVETYSGDLSEFTEEEQREIRAVISQIDALPTSDEFNAKLVEYETADDMEGYEQYWIEIQRQCADIYLSYQLLSSAQKTAIQNIDKLMELEWLWSAETLIDEINSDTPTTVAAASTKDFIELNLYDYGSNINTYYKSNNKYPGFQWNGGAYHNSSYTRQKIDYIDFGNSMITDFDYIGSSSSSDGNGKSSNAQNIGNQGGAINALDVSDYGVTNRPIGMSLNATITDTSEDVLSRTLGSDGYPALKDGTSLSYLFVNGTYATKQNTSSIDGLFQQDIVSGEYYYNSRINHAQYSNDKFTLYNQIITPNFITYPFGNFLPLNSITSDDTSTQVSKITNLGYAGYLQQIINDLLVGTVDSTEQQLIDMLARYRNDLRGGDSNTNMNNPWVTWNAADAINDYFHGTGDNPSDAITFSMDDALLKKMYNIDFDVDTNFFFGMEMKMNFMQPKNGMTGNDTNGDGASDYPMKFYFTGDDDVWVYIDDVLFLDLSGIHRHVGGEIDFVNGKVHYYYLDTATTGDVSTTPYKTYTFAEILSAAGKSTDSINTNGTFEDYTTHKFNFYYMERGSGSSVCRMNFNFPLLKENSITVTKENSPDKDVDILGNPDYYFNIVTVDNQLLVGPSSVTGVDTYTILDSGGNKVGTGTVDEYGIFTLKAGQTAVFEGITESHTEYYVQELITAEDRAQYGDIKINGADARYQQLIEWDARGWFNNVDGDNNTYTGPYGYQWYGYSGQDVDNSVSVDRVFKFEAQNGVSTENLCDFSITKQLQNYSEATTDETYLMTVKLDDEPLPIGTKYMVGGIEKTVSEAGKIELKAGETAVISNILSGTEFEVTEETASSEGYNVTYSATGVEQSEVNGHSISGIIRTGADVIVTVTNAEKGVSVPIIGTKSIINPDNQKHEFSFALQRVSDATGTTPIGIEYIDAVEITGDNPTAIEFKVDFGEKTTGTLPAKYYYKMQEIVDSADAGTVNYDPAVYIVEIEVSRVDGELQAVITNIWKDGVELGSTGQISFENELIRDLTLEKEVIGSTPDQEKEFTFEITLKEGAAPLPGTFELIRNDAGTTESITFDVNGKAIVNVKASESITIHGIPYGTTWSIKETNTDGYKVTYQIGTAGEVVQNKTVSGETLNDNLVVTCTNYTSYELPETGGIGTNSFIIGGAALIGTALLLLYNNKKRRKEAGASS